MKRFSVFGLILALLLVVSPSYAALTKSVATVDEWAAVAQNTVREGATTDISANYSSALHIDLAVTSATAHDGTKIEIQVSSNTTGDEDWTTLTSLISGIGTANSEALGGAESAGATLLEVASTTGYVADETRWIFILDNTVADSEMALLVSAVTNTSVTVQDGITNAHDASDTLFNIAANFVIAIPIDYNRVRVIYDNTVDSGGSQVHTKCRISRVTGL